MIQQEWKRRKIS